jgi:hypothetical protein
MATAAQTHANRENAKKRSTGRRTASSFPRRQSRRILPSPRSVPRAVPTLRRSRGPLSRTPAAAEFKKSAPSAMHAGPTIRHGLNMDGRNTTVVPSVRPREQSSPEPPSLTTKTRKSYRTQSSRQPGAVACQTRTTPLPPKYRPEPFIAASGGRHVACGSLEGRPK